jgi:hypothetical protein
VDCSGFISCRMPTYLKKDTQEVSQPLQVMIQTWPPGVEVGALKGGLTIPNFTL